MAPLLYQPDHAWKEAAFAQYPRVTRMGYTVRSSRYRYTAWVDANGGIEARELYDLQTDPEESRNVAGDSSYAAAAASMEDLRVNGWRSVRSNVTP